MYHPEVRGVGGKLEVIWRAIHGAHLLRYTRIFLRGAVCLSRAGLSRVETTIVLVTEWDMPCYVQQLVSARGEPIWHLIAPAESRGSIRG